MNLPKPKFREAVFLYLYSKEFFEESEAEAIIMEQLKIPKSLAMQAKERAQKIWEKKAEIDPQITKASVEYEFGRIPAIEKTVLRLGIYEMLYDEEIPEKVAISEGMRLAKKFATSESVRYINAILDSVYGDASDSKE